MFSVFIILNARICIYVQTLLYSTCALSACFACFDALALDVYNLVVYFLIEYLLNLEMSFACYCCIYFHLIISCVIFRWTNQQAGVDALS